MRLHPPCLNTGHTNERKLVFTHLSDLAKGLIFYGIVLVLAVAFTFLPLEAETVARVSMFIPFAVVLLMLLVVTRDGHLRAGWAVLLPQGIFGNLVMGTLTFSLVEEVGWRGVT